MEQTDALFVSAMRQSIAFHRNHCKAYDTILSACGFTVSQLKTAEDLHRIPPIPTLFYKGHTLRSVPEDAMRIKSTTSGTRGTPTMVGLDGKTCYYGARMLLRTLAYHRLFSPVPAHYIVLGYEPSKRNTMGAVKTAFGGTLLTPAIHREYALKDNGTGYDLNIEGIGAYLHKCRGSRFPVRLLGFPAYLYFLMKTLAEHQITFSLPPGSKILLGGGWKQFLGDAVEKEALYRMAEETLGIREENIREFFAVVESNVLYCDCKKHHFHVPVYGRVLIRDPKTLQPVPNGTPGLLNLLSPLVGSMPLGSILTDDLAVLHDGADCGCGITSPYFEVLGRAGMSEIKTCAAGANELLQGVGQ